MLDSLLCVLVKGLSALCCRLPIGPLFAVARGIGYLVFVTGGKRRRIAYANLKAAFAGKKTAREIRVILRRMYQNLAMNFVEVLLVPRMDTGYIRRYITVEDLQTLHRLRQDGTGIVFLSAHFGNWELSNVSSGLLGFPIMGLVRTQKLQKLNELLNRYRQSKGSIIISKGVTSRHLLRHLKEGGMVGMLADQDAGKNGILCPLFGRLASTPEGPFVFAARARAAIVPSFLIRTKGPFHRQVIAEPFRIGSGDAEAAEIVRGIERYNGLLEQYVSRYPEQWLWAHRRWKSTPVRRVLILDDGRAGHLHQSQAVADIVGELRAAAGADVRHLEVRTVRVAYRSSFRRFLFTLCSLFFSSRCQGCLCCMRFALDEASYRAGAQGYADLVIGTGSLVAPLVLLVAYENNARSIIIGRPILRKGSFNAIVAPRHDRLTGRNVIVTNGAPNRVHPDMIVRYTAPVRERGAIAPMERCIGVFLGGDTKDFRLDLATVKEVLQQVERAAHADGARIILTTSRRTDPDIERFVADHTAADTSYALVIIASQDTMEGAVYGMMGVGRYLVVSGESVSMVSEAASSGVPTIAFSLPKKTARLTRHETMLSAMARDGYVRYTAAGGIAACIEDLRRKAAAGTVRPLDDRSRIREGLRRVI